MPKLPIIKMSRTVIKALLGGSACKMYPARTPVFYRGTRGAVAIDAAKCILCGLCGKKCPGKAIVVERDNKTWEIDRLKCLLCGICVESCPKKCLSLLNNYSAPTAKKQKEIFPISANFSARG